MGKVNRVSNMMITKMGQYSYSNINKCEEHTKQVELEKKYKKEIANLENTIEKMEEQIKILEEKRLRGSEDLDDEIRKEKEYLMKMKARLLIKQENRVDESLKKYNIVKDFTGGKSYKQIFDENVYTSAFDQSSNKVYQQKIYEDYAKIGLKKKDKSDKKSKSTSCVETIVLSTPLTVHPDNLEDFFSGKLPGSKEALNMMKDIEEEILEDKRFKDCIFLNFTWHFDEVYVPMFEKIGEKNGKDVYRELTEKEAMERKQIKIHCHFDLIPVVKEKVKVKIRLTDENGKQLKDKKGRLMYLKKLDENGKPIKEGKRWVYETEEVKRKSLNRTKLWKTKEEKHVRGDYKDDYRKYREGLIDRVNKRHKENNLVYSNFDEKLDKMLEMMNDDDLNTYLLNLTVEKMISAENYRKELNNEIEILEDKVDIYQEEAEKLRNNNLLEEKNLEETINKKKIVDKELVKSEGLIKKSQYQIEDLTNEIDTLNIMREQSEKVASEKAEMIKKLDKKLKEMIQKETEENIHNEAMKNLYRLDKNGDFLIIDKKYILTEETSKKIQEIDDEFFAELSDLPIEKIKEVSENREVLKYLKEYFPNLKQDILEKGKAKEYGITKNIDDILK